MILNGSSGLSRKGASEQDVRDALSAAGIADVEVQLLRPELDMAQLIRDRAGQSDAVIAVGGDGTVSTVAAALAGTETPMGVLPAGTLNHFAKDTGIPTDIAEAARVVAGRHTTQVDVARLNGRVFINNSSIGLYPAMVRVRERLMGRGWPKRAAMIAGSLAAVWQFPNLRIRLSTTEGGVVTRTPFVFVGNNSYQLSGFDAGTRAGLRDGVLQVWTVRNPTRLALFTGLLRTLWGGLPEMHMEHAADVRIRTIRRRVRVALDGEIVLMESPLHYAIWPRALRVLVPRPAESKES